MVSKKPKEYLSRRKFAATFSGAVLASIAGCSGGGNGGGGGEATPTETATATPTATATATATPTSTPSEPADATIKVGPNGSPVFDPENLRVSKGDVVEWVAQSAGHNVACNPNHHPKCSLPEGAEPFTSYKDANVGSTMPTTGPGSTFRHKFTVTGDYTYVCIPHVSTGMIGHITVR